MTLPDGRVVLGPAMRADLVIDMSGDPGARFTVADTFYRGLEYRLLDLVYSDEPPLRPHPLDAPLRLAANTVPEPRSASGRASRGDVRRRDDGRNDERWRDDGRHDGGMMRGMQHAGIWSINGVAATGHVMEPFLPLQRGRSYVLAMHNDTAWHHPMHLHGHSFPGDRPRRSANPPP